MINPSFIIIKIISLQTAITFAVNDNKTSINNNQTRQINGKIVDFNNQESLSCVAISNVKYEICFYNILGTLVYKQKASSTDNIKYQVNIQKTKNRSLFYKNS